MVSKRITIVFDEQVLKKLRIIQSKNISKLTENVSFSCVIREELRKSLKYGIGRNNS